MQLPGFSEIFFFSILLFILFRKPILRFVGRLLARRLQKFAQKQQAQYQNQFQQRQQHQTSSHQDGETFISKDKRGGSKNSVETDGEYVDFEEV